MSTIGKSMFPLQTSMRLITGMKERYDQLQGQLATGQRASNLAEMGASRFYDLSMRSRIARMESYGDTMTAVNLRLDVFDTTLSRLDKIEAEQRTSAVPGGRGTGNINFATAPATSLTRLDEVLSLLNTDVDGRYLFGGGRTDQKPVATASEVMDGASGRAGFRTVLGERIAADAGNGLGRLGIATATDTVTLAEDGTHPFGLKLSTLSSSSGDIVLTQPAGAPPQLGVQFNTATLPVAGSTVTTSFTMPDGTSEAVTLKAVSGTPGAGEFQIGADGDTTAASFAAALDTSIRDLVGTKLATASTCAAADNFFNGHGQPVLRVSGPPATATALVNATASDTVMWYRGEDSADARGSVNAKVDDGTTVRYGVQANETGILELVRSLASMAATTFPDADATSAGRFDALASRQIDNLSEGNNNQPGSIEVIGVSLALAKTTIGNTQERHTAHKAQLETMLSDIETVAPEEVSMEILALKTRLEASYATTSLVSQLSLVNYLP